MKIVAPNTTHIPNVIFDYWMDKLTPAEFKVLLCICRKTFGWHKEKDRISRSQIVTMTGLNRDTVRKALSVLSDHQLILIYQSFTEHGDNDANTYEINVEENPGVGDLNAQGLADRTPRGWADKTPHKRNLIQKKDIQSIYAPPEGDAKSPSSSFSEAKKKPKAPFKSVCLVERLPSHPAAEKFKNYFDTPLIGIDDRDHEELVAQYGAKLVSDAYAFLADWKLSKAEVSPKTVKEHTDLRRLKKWVFAELLKNPQKLTGVGSHRKWAIEIDKKPIDPMEKRRYAWGTKTEKREEELLEYLKKVHKKEGRLLGKMSNGQVDELEAEMLQYFENAGVNNELDSL